MTRHRYVALSMILGLTFVGSSNPALADQCDDFSDVVLFATNSIRLSSNVVVASGNVVANDDAGAGPTLSAGGTFEVYIDRKASVVGDVNANRVKILKQATVGGTVFYRDLLENSGTVGGSVDGLTLPVFGSLPPMFTGPSNGPDVSVAVGGAQTLTPGDYGDIFVDDDGVLTLGAGRYNVKSLDFMDDVTLSFQGLTEIRVAERIRTRRRATINATGSGVGADEVVFYVNGINGADGELGSTPVAARIGSASTVNANFFVPNGTLRVEVDTVAAGAFLARDVQLDRGVQLDLATFFFNRSPYVVTPIADVAVSEDAADTVLDLSGTFDDPDILLALQTLTLSVTSNSNPGLVSATLSGTSLTLDYQADQFGTATIVVTATDDGCPQLSVSDSFDVTVTSVNDPVNLTNDAGATNEDVAVNIVVLDDDNAGPANELQTLTVAAVTQGASGSVTTDGSTVTYDPSPDFFGSDSFTYQACDAGDGADDPTVLCAIAAVDVTVDSVNMNNAPSFVKGPDQVVDEDAEAQEVAGWATNISPGPANESGQAVSFSVTNDNNGLFASQPAVDPAGTLTYKPAPNAFGSAIVWVTAIDDGGTANGGDNTSAAQDFTITVHSVNDPPGAVADGATTPEETLVTIDVLANDTGGPANEDQTTTLDDVSQAASGTTALVAGKVDYTPNPDFFGADTFDYTVCDGGSDDNTATDADDLCATGSVTVTVTAVNDPPTADPQDLFATATVVITLTGSDPDGDSLTFTVTDGPITGTLGAVTPIEPIDDCVDPERECGDGAVTSATVEYTPDSQLCSGVPLECPEDVFTFQVSDGALADTADVTLNPGGDPTVEPPDLGEVVANDLQLDVVVNAARTVTLSAAAPDTVAVTFRIETLPAGTLADSDGTEIAPADLPYDLPSPVVIYAAPATVQATSFTFSARDSSTTGSPCGSPSCDTAVVNIDVGNAPELAPDQSVGTDLNTPVEITLRANSGGTAGGGSSAQALPSAVTVTYGDNGPPRRPVDLKAGPAGPTALGVDQGWSQFGWCDTDTSPSCTDLVDLVNETEVDESPFDFTTTENSCLRVTDTLAKGDHWRVESVVGGNVDWTDFTSEVPQSTVGTTGDPDVAFGDLEYSHGEFDLSAGTFSIRLITIPPDSFAFGTAGYIRVDTGPCVDIVWTVTSLPAAGTGLLTNLDGSAVQVGATYFAEPTVVFTPAFNFNGSASFAYSVSQGGTVGTAILDTAIVDVLVSATDPCILVGRPLGCAPGSSAQAQAETEGVEYVSELGDDDGPSDGLTLIVEGEGTVASGPVRLKDNRVLRGLVCSSECTKQFPVGSFVGVNARPEPGSEFVGWSGACEGDYPIGAVRLGKQTVCKATFVKEEAAE